MKEYFFNISEKMIHSLTSDEHLNLSINGENSEFIRINNAKVRQSGTVCDTGLSIELIKNNRKNNRLEQLSKREMEILTFINQGMSNEDIADHLCRAKGTVKLHVHNIYKKLDIRNRVEAIQLYNQFMSAENA